MLNNDVLNQIGLAVRAKQVISGEENVLKTIRKKSAALVFLANDAGINTTKRITDKANFYNIALENRFSSAELSKAIGKENRMVISIMDQGLALSIQKKL